jgi:hypothetical protein
MPFRNYSLTKNGQLTIGQIFSPDFTEGISGWEIRKDGSVEFNNGTFRGTISGGTLIISQGSGATFEQVEIDGATGITTWSKYQSPTVVIRQILANGTDLIYADPGNGNPQGALAFSVSQAAGTDQFSNPYQAGINVYGTGTSLTGIQEITGQAVLFFMPDSSSAFSNAISPNVFSLDTGSGTAEFMELQVNSGAPSGFTSRRSRVILFSGSPDGTTSVPHVGVYGGNNDSLIADFNPGGITAVQPGTSATLETWHSLPLANSWVATSNGLAHYKITPENQLIVEAAISGGTSTTICTLPAGYRPANRTMYFPVAFTGANTASVFGQINTAGVLSLSTITTIGTVVLNAVLPLDVP